MAIEGDFAINSHQGVITITRTESRKQLSFAPSETAAATHIVGLALSMVNLDRIPDHIKNTPFVVRFFPGSVFALERVDQEGSIPFRLAEGDELIRVLRMAKDICLNEQTHGRAIPSNVNSLNNLMTSDEPT